MNHLTPNQQAALARDKNIAVTAGAGTGKTRILVDRYVDILLNEEVEVKELLAITFTNKAASEMLERVSENVMLRLKSEEDAQRRKKLTHIHNHLSSAQISTIHAFCARLLREYPLESGNLDPGFRQTDDFEMDLLIDDSITEQIKQINPTDDEWLDMFRLFGAHNIRMMLEKSLDYRYELSRTTQRFQNESLNTMFDSLANQFFNLVTEQFSPSYLDSIQSVSLSLLQSSVIGQSSNEKKETALNVLNDYCAEVNPDTLSYWKYLYLLADHFTKRDGGAYKNLAQLGGKNAWTTQEMEWLLQLSDMLVPIAEWKKNAISTSPDEIDRVVLRNLVKFNHLYLLLDLSYQDKKRQISAVDYEDLQLMTLHLLENHQEIKNQIASRYKYIMVDEFQDTNKVQWEIISRLGEDSTNKYFIVGDPKQSIYGFRAADVRVFNTVKKEFAAKNIESDHLLFESFRFKEILSRFINHIFPKILKQSESNPWEVAYDDVEPKREDSEGGQVEFTLLDKSDDENIQAAFIANRILELLETTDYEARDIGIIMRSRTHLTEIEKQLRDHDISFRTVGGIGFYQGQEIYDVYHMIKFLINPNDDLALVGVLRSPFANISDLGLFHLSTYDREEGYWDELRNLDKIDHLSDDDRQNLRMFIEKANQWKNRRDRIGLYELLTEIFSDSLYRSVVAADLKGDQILANIEKILNYALIYEKNQSGSIVDFSESLKYLINRHQKEGEAILDLNDDNTVKIMTIHQSKGLEFPIVFLPFLDQSSGSSASHSIYFDESFGTVAKIQKDYFTKINSNSESCFIYDLAKFKQKNKEYAELKRLFYVGCTRARDHLILSAQLKKDKVPEDTPLSWLMMAMNKEHDQLENGWLELENDLKILIHRSFDGKITSQDHDHKNIITSLDELRTIKETDIDTITTPPILLPTNDHPQGEIFSATQLLTFKEDRREYQQRYHLGYFEDDYEKIGLGEVHEEHALVRGTLVHKMMERYPDYNIDDLISEMDISDASLISDLKEDIGYLETKIRNSTQILDTLQAQNFKNEINILRQLGNDFLTGTLDKIFQDEKGNWVVLDYKTNRISKKDVDSTARRYKVQMDVYALLLQSVFPKQENYEVRLYFIDADEVFCDTYTRDRIKSHEREFEKLN